MSSWLCMETLWLIAWVLKLFDLTGLYKVSSLVHRPQQTSWTCQVLIRIGWWIFFHAELIFESSIQVVPIPRTRETTYRALTTVLRHFLSFSLDLSKMYEFRDLWNRVMRNWPVDAAKLSAKFVHPEWKERCFWYLLQAEQDAVYKT